MNSLYLAGLGIGLSLSMNVFAEAGHDDHHREHGSHTHGVTQLNIAFEGTQLLIEMESPAANIVGFEYKPETAADKAALKAAMAQLAKPAQLFITNADAACQYAHHEVETSMQHDDHHDKHGAHEKHDDHHDEHGAHEKHDAHHDEHHGEHDEETHSDFTARYEFVCIHAADLKEIDVQLFTVFPKTQQVNVQYIGDGGQQAARLDPEHSVFHLPAR